MGSFANSLFKIMLGWVQGAASAVWSAFTNENGTSFFDWIGRNWILIAAVLCIIGLGVDLCVYIFRWKPFRVWKSYFARKKESPDEILYNRQEANRPETAEPVHEQRQTLRNGQESEMNKEKRTEPDFSLWEPEAEDASQENAETVQPQNMVTNAGYVVPADSPYRRPVPPDTAGAYDPEGELTDISGRTERDGPAPVTPKRRRRITVAELFTDPEEELKQFDAPQQVIDSRKAYRDPVYPRGWKKSEEDGE